MSSVEIINRALRDFQRYTGDGKPNAPSGAPLPVGDPRSGVHNPSKADFREFAIGILQAQGDPVALASILQELERKAGLTITRDVMRNGLILTLVTTGGTAARQVAAFNPEVIAFGITSLGASSIVEFTPGFTNTDDKVSLDITGTASSNWRIYQKDGSNIASGDLVAGLPVLLRRVGNAWRIIGQSNGAVVSLVNATVSTLRGEVNALLDRVVHYATEVVMTDTRRYTVDLPNWFAKFSNRLPPAGMIVCFKPDLVNTQRDPQLMIKGTGTARGIVNELGLRIEAGELTTDREVLLKFNGTSWVTINGYYSVLRKMATDLAAMTTKFTALENSLVASDANAVKVVRQTTSAIPDRPNSKFVEWYCWNDPTSRMQPWDKWIRMPTPNPPAIASLDDLNGVMLESDMAGNILLSMRNDLPEPYPPLTSLDIRVDGGNWRMLSPVPTIKGGAVAVGKYTAGAHQAEFRYTAFNGSGPPSRPRTFRAHVGEFIDPFDVLFQSTGLMSARDMWDASSLGKIVIPSGDRGFWVPTQNKNHNYATVVIPEQSKVAGLGLSVSALATFDPSSPIGVGVGLVGGGNAYRLFVASDGTWKLNNNGTVTFASGPAPTTGEDVQIGLITSRDGSKVDVYFENALVATIPNEYALSTAVMRPCLFGYVDNAAYLNNRSFLRDFKSRAI